MNRDQLEEDVARLMSSKDPAQLEAKDFLMNLANTSILRTSKPNDGKMSAIDAELATLDQDIRAEERSVESATVEFSRQIVQLAQWDSQVRT